MDLNLIINELIKDVNKENVLNREDIIYFIDEVRLVLFLGFYEKIEYDLNEYVENKIISIINILTKILISINHNNIEYVCDEFIKQIPVIKKKLNGDLHSFLSTDPAVFNESEVIHCYPGYYAISLYRIANCLVNLNVDIIPRFISEYAHCKTGIDIHPKANIGENFFIDHGTGVVIGETTLIGDNVKIYQGVTLGAISLSNVEEIKNKKRHPTIEDNVVIYSNTIILGGETIIGKNSIIGCNVFITNSVDEFSKVIYSKNK